MRRLAVVFRKPQSDEQSRRGKPDCGISQSTLPDVITKTPRHSPDTGRNVGPSKEHRQDNVGEGVQGS